MGAGGGRMTIRPVLPPLQGRVSWMTMLDISEALTYASPSASLIKAGVGAPLSVILQRIGCASKFDNHPPQAVL